MKQVLVVGGCGFIGSHIVDYLHHQNIYHVKVLDNFSLKIHGEDYRDSYLFKHVFGKAVIIKGDVRNPDDIAMALNDVDEIIYLASETGTGQSMYSLNEYTDVNIKGLSNLFEVIIKNKFKIKKIILSSSRAVYGEGMSECLEHGIVHPRQRDIDNMLHSDFENRCPICNAKVKSIPTDETSPLTPISYYGFTKLAQEKMIECLCPVYGIQYTIFRYYNVYGAGQSLNNPYTGIVSIFSKLILQNKEINIFEDGLESRDFVHVKDVAEITCRALSDLKSNSQIINVGTGIPVTVLEVANTLKAIFNSSSRINITGNFRIGDIRHNTSDLNQLDTVFNIRPRIFFSDGIKDFTQWVLKEIDTEMLNKDGDPFEKSLQELRELNLLLGTSENGNHESNS